MAKTGPKPRPESERFWEKVDVRGSAECWPWTGATTGLGYGVFRVGSQTDGTRRMVMSHRWVCAAEHGMAEDEQALHHCDNKPCCNPAHIYPGTHADNMRDAAERGTTGGRPMPGEANPNAKLTADDVRAIRASTRTAAALARRFGVSRTHIGYIKQRRSWEHI